MKPHNVHQRRKIPFNRNRTRGKRLRFQHQRRQSCYCDDIHRDAVKRNLAVERVEVEVDGGFEVEGQPAKNVSYRAGVVGRAREEQIRELMIHADLVAEIHNTLRVLTPLILEKVEAIPSRRI